MMDANLKRCPFCGQLPTTRFSVSGMNLERGDVVDFEVLCPERGDVVNFEVLCPKCGTCKLVRLTINRENSNFTEVEKAMAKVKVAWNMRWDDEEEKE